MPLDMLPDSDPKTINLRLITAPIAFSVATPSLAPTIATTALAAAIRGG